MDEQLTPAEFAQLRRLKPVEAMQWMQERSHTALTFAWEDLLHEEHSRHFTISRLARLDLLQSLHAMLLKSVNGDLSRRDWQADAEKLLADAGWWGEKQVIDPTTGEAVKTVFNPARLALIFDTNTRQAYAAGLWQRIQAAKRTMPYLRYVTRDDDRVRPQHAAWHNVVLPVDDPFWQSHFPPNGYRCRCRVIPLSQRDYERGYSESRPGAEYDINAPIVREPFKTTRPPEVQFEHINQRTGEVSLVPKGISPGFAYNAGQARELVLKQMAEAKLRAAEKALADAARKAGVTVPKIAKEVEGQPDWISLGKTDLLEMPSRTNAPPLLPMAQSLEEAVSTLRGTLGVPVGAARGVQTPVGQVTILDELLVHVVEKRQDARERYANFVLPSLMSPDEIWETAYDDGTRRRRFIKLFSDSKYDLLVVVHEQPNGQLFWNMMQRKRKSMNALRVGALLHEAR